MRKQNLPKISIVTPSYNQGEFLEETIRSVLDQQYPNLEYIVIDGGSSDKSVDIIKKYEARLAYWVSEPDRGQTHAINKGFQHASGDICAYLNSDDVYATDILRVVAEDYIVSADRDRFWKAYVVKTFNAEGFIDTVYPNQNCELPVWLSTAFGLLQPGVFWTRQMYRDIGGFDEGVHYVFDRYFFMQLLKKGYAYDTSQEIVAAHFRIHEGAKTQKDNLLFQAEYKSCDRAFIKSYPLQKRLPLTYRTRRCCAWGLLADCNRSGIGRRQRMENLVYALLKYPLVVGSKLFWKIVFALPYPEHRV